MRGASISKRRPDVVVGVGGFASGPVLALAAVRGYPTMLLEQNALPGITNRLLSRVVRAAAVNFDAALTYFPGTGFVAGNPVRPEFFPAQNEELNDKTSVPRDAARVLIFGGSQGAHAINVAMVEAASRLAASGIRLAITHQTGERDLDLVRAAYQRAGLEARVEAYIYEIDREMKRPPWSSPVRARPRWPNWPRQEHRRFSCRCRTRPMTTSGRTPTWWPAPARRW